MPSVTPGQYHIIVRADIFDQIALPAGVPISSKTTASAGLLTVAVDGLTLGVPYATTLSDGQERLLQVTVPQGATLEVSLTSNASGAANEIYIKQGAAPTDSVYDAAYQGGAAPDQDAIIPSTVPGVYYVLIVGNSEPGDDTPVTVLAQLLPLSITGVQTDQGGDSRYVTTTITGAQFQPNAIVKLVMPGFAEYQPVLTDFVNGTEILAEFDLTAAPYGLYDVQVTNPDGRMAIAPYRFQVEQTIEPDVTIGIGGPRFILAGDTGTYSVELEDLGNINAPYVEFNVGIPQLSNEPFPADPSQPLVLPPINVNVYDLPYVEFNTNLGGSPPDSDAVVGGPVRHAPVVGRHRRRQRPHPGARLPVQRGRGGLHRLHLQRDDVPRPGGDGRPELRRARGRALLRVPGLCPRGDPRRRAAGARADLARAVRRLRGRRRAGPDGHPVHPVPVRHQRLGHDADPRRVRGPGHPPGRRAADGHPRRQHRPHRAAEPRRRPDGLGGPVPRRAGAGRRPAPRRHHAADRHGSADHERDGDPRHRRPRGPGGQRHHLRRRRRVVLQRPARLVRQQHRPDVAGRRLQRARQSHRHPADVEPVRPGRAVADQLRGLQRLRPLGELLRPGRPAAVVPDHQRAGRQRPARHPAGPGPVPHERRAGRRAGVDDRPVHGRGQGRHPGRPALAVHDQLPERPRGHDRAGPRSGSPPSSTPASTPARSGWATSRSATSTSRSPATSRSTRAPSTSPGPRGSTSTSARGSTSRRGSPPG